MAAKEQDIALLEWHFGPFVVFFPAGTYPSSVGKLNLSLVRAWNNLQAAVGDCRFINCNIRREMCNFTNVTIRVIVYMRLEPVSIWQLVVDLVLEENHVLPNVQSARAHSIRPVSTYLAR